MTILPLLMNRHAARRPSLATLPGSEAFGRLECHTE